ncbi:MAG: hypothetical protein EXQ56_07345 [Acidobacteria bacterium]|nr:hypothetical protein [Acidobacteriota bacterium]
MRHGSKRLVRWISLLAALLAPISPGMAFAQSSAGQAIQPSDAWREAPPVSTGIAVGKKIPAFSVPDQTGKPRDFKSVVGPNGAMIVFQRSVDW